MKEFQNGLFIFRRDFRIIDNTGLNYINSVCENVYTLFIFTPEQVSNKNDFKSNNSIQFMITSLQELKEDINKNNGTLLSSYGKNNDVIEDFIKKHNIQILCFNKDYTPYAIERDNEINDLCLKNNIICKMTPDYYLHEPGTIFTLSDTPYKKFTPYYETSLKEKFIEPKGKTKLYLKKTNYKSKFSISLDEAFDKFTKYNENILVQGGRNNALKMLKNAVKTQKHFDETRNDLYKNTSELSSYIKYGCVSVREVKKSFKNNKDFIRQLIWRDFYANILFSFPYVLGSPMKSQYNKIRWSKNKKYLEDWKKGQTGFPIVDACMRQMNETGYMHNRGRLIVASFLIKTLLINWEDGEKYFATKLTDYDPASNNGNWQWVASTGADSQPYFRIFNPWSQSAKYDPDAVYIKHWVPELENVSSKDIHLWYSKYEDYKVNYPKPIVDYSLQREKALKIYKTALN